MGTKQVAATTPVAKLAAINDAWIRALGRGDVDANAMMIFLMIAERADGDREITQAEVFARSGLSEAAVSRNIAILGKGHTMSNPGPQLIEAFKDLDNRRRNILRLTRKGRAFFDSLKEIVQ